MSKSIFNDLALRSISFALDGLSLRQRVTANNIANVDTPGFKAQQVSFEEQLQQALNRDEATLPLETTAPGHLSLRQNQPSSDLIAVTHHNNTLRNDGNNVDIDLEMTTLAETTVRFQALTQLAGTKLALLKDIVREGR